MDVIKEDKSARDVMTPTIVETNVKPLRRRLEKFDSTQSLSDKAPRRKIDKYDSLNSVLSAPSTGNFRQKFSKFKFDSTNSLLTTSKFGGDSVTAPTRENVSTWSQLFLKRNWVEIGFQGGSSGFDSDDDDDEEVISLKEVIKHFLLKSKHDFVSFRKTCRQNPCVLLKSFVCFLALFGCGFIILYSFKESYIIRKQEIATRLAMETGIFYQDALNKAITPIFSLGQIVKHDDTLRSLSRQIGVLGANASAPADTDREGYRNVKGICDDRDLIKLFDSIVMNLKQDAHLLRDGTMTNLQIAPQGVFCLSSPKINYEDFQDGKFQDMTDYIGKDLGSPLTNSSEKIAMEKTLTLTSDENPLFFTGPFNYKMKNGEVLSSAMFSMQLSVPIPILKQQNLPEMKVNGMTFPSWGILQGWINWERLQAPICAETQELFHELKLSYKLSKRLIMKYESGNNRISESTVFRDIDGTLVPKDSLIEGKEYIHVHRLASLPNFNENYVSDRNSVVVPIQTINSEWIMTVVDENNFYPPWYSGGIAALFVVSLAFSILFLIITVEKKQHQVLLYKMMPKKVIRKLNKGKTVVEKYNLVSIFFSDIVGFTNLASSMKPVEIMKMLNDLYVEFDELVDKHKLYKVETIGDAYMVLAGGSPCGNISTVEAAEKIALFALDAIEVVKNLKVTTSSGQEGKIFIRAGIASGPVVAGVIGNAMPRYCLFGDTVNFASRMESTSMKMKIQCCDTTNHLLINSTHNTFKMEERVDIENDGRAGVFVKGKGWTHSWWITDVEKRDMNVGRIHSTGPSHLSNASSCSTLHSSDSIDVQNLDTIALKLTKQPFQHIGNTASLPLKLAVVPESSSKSEMIQQLAALLQYRLRQLQRSRQQSPSRNFSTKLTDIILSFVAKIENLYMNIPYHSFLHASHVSISTNKLIDMIVPDSQKDPLIMFSMVFSALIHDVTHRGIPNFVLIKLGDKLSTKYQNISIMEKNSIITGLDLFLRTKEFEPLRQELFSSEQDTVTFQQIVMSTILSTDIFFKERMDKCKRRWEVAFSKTIDADEAYASDIHIHSFGVSDINIDYRTYINKIDIEQMCPFYHTTSLPIDCLQKSVFLEHLIQVADVSHCYQDWEVFLKFNYRLVAELYSCYQSGWMDDVTQDWYSGQMKFFDDYAIPLAERFQTCCKALYGEQGKDFLITNVKINKSRWQKEGKNVCSVLRKGLHDGDTEEMIMKRIFRASCKTGSAA